MRKIIYDNYNNSSEKLTDILSEMLRNKMIDIEDLTDLIKDDPTLLNIFRTECNHLNLLKGKEKVKEDINKFFGD